MSNSHNLGNNKNGPLRTGGSLHTTHKTVFNNESLIVRPSASNRSISIICLVLSAFCFALVILTALYKDDIFGALALSVGCISLFVLGIKTGSNPRTFRFIKSSSTLVGLEDPLRFDDMVEIEVLKKIVGGKTQSEPFSSGEVVLLKKDGSRYLLVEGGNFDVLKKIASEIAEYTNTPLHIDKTPIEA